MEAKMEVVHELPEYMKEITHGHGIIIYEYRGYIGIRGIIDEDILFKPKDWDLFSAVIAYADLKIRKVVE